MDMGGVVPAGGERVGRAVENDLSADEDDPLDLALDGSELM
jgi:hypothetical protein